MSLKAGLLAAASRARIAPFHTRSAPERFRPTMTVRMTEAVATASG